MVKLLGPACSLNAAGSIADSVVFSSWKGRTYIRKHVKPSNPKSAAQTGFRAAFSYLSKQWQNLSAANQATYDALAAELNVSPFNAYLSFNQSRWRRFAAPSKETPATEIGTLPVAVNTSATWIQSQVEFKWQVIAAQDAWGIAIFRDTATPVVTAPSNLVHIALAGAPGFHTWLDDPPAVTTYYYNSRFFTDDGVLGPEENEQTATP